MNKNAHMFEYLYNHYDELDEQQVLTLIKQRVVDNRNAPTADVLQYKLDKIEKIVDRKGDYIMFAETQIYEINKTLKE